MCSQVRVSAIFAFVSFVILLSFSGVPAHIDEVKVSPLPLHGACTACVLKNFGNGLDVRFMDARDLLCEPVPPDRK